MLFFILGLPGGFSGWCETVAAELLRRAGGVGEVIRADTLDQVALSAIHSGASHAVVSSEQPGGGLRAALADHRRNYVVALDDPRRALIELVLGREIELAASVQMLASSCAALSGCAATPGVSGVSGVSGPLLLYGERDWPRAADTVAAIARHLEIPVGEDEIADLADGLEAADAVRPEYDSIAWWNSLAPAEQELVIGALAPYVDQPSPGAALSIAWGRDLFFLGDRPRERARGPIDITGRARCLVQGPDIMLPPGSWSLSLTALFSRGAAEHQFLAEVWAAGPIASAMMRPHGEGSAAVTLDFALNEAGGHPIAVRVSSQRAAFDGSIEIVGARLLRAALVPDEE